MAEKNWHVGSTLPIAVQAVVCLAAAVAPARAFALSDSFAPPSYLGELNPNVIWEALIAGVVICSFLAAIALWIHSSLRRTRRLQLRRNAFISSAMNNLNQGVVMTDAQRRVIFCNDRYLEIYGLGRSELWSGMTGPDILALRRKRGVLGVASDDEFYEKAASTNGLITELPDGRAILVKYFVLPNGGSVATHLDVSEQRRLSRQLASTKQFLETVLDNVPACVAAKSIEDGRYIFANSAYERFWGFSRDQVVGKNARELFGPNSAASIEATDRAALIAPAGQYRNEFEVERGATQRMVASIRIVVRNESNKPEFLLVVFEDITDRRSLSQELESTKKFLELVVDNIPVALIVEQVKDGRYLLANRSAETILNRRREDATGLTASDIFNPKEAKLIIARDEAAIKKRGMITEEHPISTKDGLRLFLTRRATVLSDAGEPQYLIKTHEDVTDRRQTESRMAHMAYHDGLTDLPNRAAFLQALTQMIEACEGTGEEFLPFCASTSTVSRRSTTSSVMRTATSFWSRWPSGSRTPRAAAWWHVCPATSSA
ncbi:PAS domain S-box-containing protein [Bradyrhizobium sp. LM6.11]